MSKTISGRVLNIDALKATVSEVANKPFVKKYSPVITLVAASAFAVTAAAITAPATGSFAYDLYDVGVNDMLKGAPGFIGGLLGIVYSASKLSANWMWASLGVLGSTCVIKADAITSSLGMLL